MHVHQLTQENNFVKALSKTPHLNFTAPTTPGKILGVLEGGSQVPPPPPLVDLCRICCWGGGQWQVGGIPLVVIPHHPAQYRWLPNEPPTPSLAHAPNAGVQRIFPWLLLTTTRGGGNGEPGVG